MNASVVIGQQDFSGSSSNQNSNASANTLGSPQQAVTDGTRLFVAESANHRVLIYNRIPTINNTSADVVVGQSSFTASSANQGGSANTNTLNAPNGVFSDGQKLFISDTGNHRVLIFNSIPTSNNASADVVIGQVNFSGSTANQGGSAGANTLSSPRQIFSDRTHLFITDHSNHRVLIFNAIPTSNNASANVVIGQSTFSATSANQGGSAAANTLNQPWGVYVKGSRLFIAERSNHRVLIFNSIPTTNNASADVVIGQPDFVSVSVNQGSTIKANTLRSPQGIDSDGQRLFIADSGNSTTTNNRVLIYNQIPTSNNASADIVIGEPDFTTGAVNTFNSPRSVAIAGNKLIVDDINNHRLLIFNNIINTPQINISSLDGATDGKLRVTGNIKINDGNYNVWKVEASVNGGDYASVSNLTIPTFYPGYSQSQTASFYHDFEPWSMNNGSQSNWTTKQAEMLADKGYTLKLRGYNTNADIGEHVFYFQPFTINNLSKTLSPTSPISFSVNKYQRTELKENLDHYEVWIKPLSSSPLIKGWVGVVSDDDTTNNITEGSWQKYITNIPVDYDLVREYTDNLRRTDYIQDPGQGNGVYENQDLLVTFSNSSSTIVVRKKGKQEGTIDLSPGTYQVKISSIDKAHHTQDTDPVTVTIKGLPNNKKNLPLLSSDQWFPLQINSISGSNLVNISNFGNPSTSLREYNSAISTVTPMIKGVAFTDSTITLTVTSGVTQESRTYTTKVQDSRWILQPQFFPGTNLIDISAEDEQGRYTELPTMTLTLNQEPKMKDVQGVTSIQATTNNLQPITNLPTPKPNPSPTPSIEPQPPNKMCFFWICF